MNEFKGTPGPWKADYWLDGEPSVMFDGPALTRVCRMEYITKADAVPNDEMEANADLISAAPDLLEALQRLMSNDCPLTGNPTYEELVEHWEYEDSQGRGEAQDQLFALRAVAKALGK